MARGDQLGRQWRLIQTLVTSGAGRSAAELGPRVRPKELDFGEAKRTERGIEATVIYVDRFGNLVTSITIMKKGTGSASPAEVLQAEQRQ